MKDEREFDTTWRHYSSGQSGQPPTSDYHSYHYGPAPVFPHHSYGQNQQSGDPSGHSSHSSWSNGQDIQPFLSQYESQQQPGHYAMEAMFGSNNYFSTSMTSSMANPIQNSFNAFFPSNSDPFWPPNQHQNKQRVQNPYRVHQEETNYYHPNAMAADYAMPDLKHVEGGISGLTLDHIKESSIAGPFSEQKKTFESVGSSGAVGQVPKKTTWASIASQPAKPQPKSLKSKMSSSVLTGSTSKHLPPVSASMETIGTWEVKNGNQSAQSRKTPPQSQATPLSVPPPSQPQRSQAPPPQQNTPLNVAPPTQWRGSEVRGGVQTGSGDRKGVEGSVIPHPVLDKLKVENNYNPKEFDLNPKNARFFIIKSYSEDDIHRSIKYSIWCSTEHGNKRLDGAFKQQHDKGPIYLLYSVNGSGHFCGMAQMMSSVDYNASSSVWAQDKWKGQFKVKWIYVKDVPNAQLRHIRLENNENKPVTNSRDTQEVPLDKGRQVIKIMHHYRHTTSIFDDFLHYEKRQEEESQRRVSAPNEPPSAPSARGGRGGAWGSGPRGGVN